MFLKHLIETPKTPILGALLATTTLVTPAIAQTSWILPGQSVEEVITADPQNAFVLGGDQTTPVFGPRADRLQPTSRAEQALFAPGAVVITGFSGTRQRLALLPVGATDLADPEALQFIDPDGASVVLVSLTDIGAPFDGQELVQPAYDKILARDVGQVFGVTTDDAEFPNLYLTATAAFGLYIVGPDENSDRVPDRLVLGQDEARWMPGQWGHGRDAGPGSVWKVDGRTGQVSLFATIPDNAAASLGNIAFDAAHQQLFVSDLESGLVHRIALDGALLEAFDHGVVGRNAAGMPIEPFDDTARADITTDDFDVEDPDTWGFAAEERRVWGLSVHNSRLYYAVADGPTIWSVPLDETGAIFGDPQLEITLDGSFARAEVTDLGFASDGALLITQRASTTGEQDYQRLAKPRRAVALRFVQEYPDDLDTPSIWVQEPTQIPLGVIDQSKQATGGLAFGPGYDDQGNWDYNRCGNTLWLTGDALRLDDDRADRLALNGALQIDGVQAFDLSADYDWSDPEIPAHFYDFDGIYGHTDHTGWVGDVAVLGCDGQGGAGGFGGDDTGGSCTDPGGCVSDPPPPPPKPDCMAISEPIYQCDKTTGTYSATAIFSSLMGSQDTVEITDQSGALTGVPASMQIPNLLTLGLGTLAPGDSATLEMCGFNKTAKDSGTPFECCKAEFDITAPQAACDVEEE